MDITHITSLLGGVALFLYGMSIMGAGLENWQAARCRAYCKSLPPLPSKA